MNTSHDMAAAARRHVVAAAALAAIFWPAWAAAAEPSAPLPFDVPAQDVHRSLETFSKVTGLKVRVDPNVPAVKAAQAVQGSLAPAQAMDRLLRGTGLTYRFEGGNTVHVSRAVDDGSRVTGTLQVEGGAAAGIAAAGGPAGPNGSSDSTATEGTHSLAAQSASIGSKTPLALKDTPQTISVVTRQRIEDQHLDSLSDVLDQVAGLTVSTNGTNGTAGINTQQQFFSRGFQIQNFQVDGGAPLTIGNTNFTSQYQPIFDLSQYDHVEVLRGADGLYAGVGDPGGVINLTRKAPLDHRQVVFDASVGSFSHRRASLDVSTPLVADGRIAVRGVLTHDDTPFFYGDKKNRLDMAYINAEFKPVAGTQINLGGSITQRDALPWQYGLPRATNGSALALSRDLCLCLDDNLQKTHETELFAQLRQQLGVDWSLAVNVTGNRQNGFFNIAQAVADYSGVPGDGSGLSVSGSRQALAAKQLTTDATLTGSFEAFGHRHQLTVGVDRTRSDGVAPDGSVESLSWDQPANLYTFNPRDYPYSTANSNPTTSQVLSYRQVQWGAYGTLRLNPLDTLHLTLGIRRNDYRTRQSSTPDGSTVLTDTDFHESHTSPPFVSVAYDLTPTMSAYASYASIYQSQARLVRLDGTPISPTTGSNIEVGVKRSDFGGTLQSSLAVYSIEQKNFALQDFANSFPPPPGPPGISCCWLIVPGQKKLSKGVDMEVSGALTPRWQIAAGYTFNLNQLKPGEQPYTLPAPLTSYAARHLFKLWSTYSLQASGWWVPQQIGAGGRVQSRTYNAGSVCNADYSECNATEFAQAAYALLDLMARWQVVANTSVQLNVKNVLDRTYYQSIGSLQGGNWYGEPRNVRLALNVKF